MLRLEAYAIGALLILAAATGYVVYRRIEKGGIGAVLPVAINPGSDQNLAYRGVNALGGSLTGQGDSFALGSWIRDMQERVTGTGAYAPEPGYLPIEAPAPTPFNVGA
jgi:hypothetical protein